MRYRILASLATVATLAACSSEAPTETAPPVAAGAGSGQPTDTLIPNLPPVPNPAPPVPPPDSAPNPTPPPPPPPPDTLVT